MVFKALDGHQVKKGSDQWEMGNKGDEPYDGFSLLPCKFLACHIGRENPGGTRQNSWVEEAELRIQAARIFRAD